MKGEIPKKVESDPEKERKEVVEGGEDTIETLAEDVSVKVNEIRQSPETLLHEGERALGSIIEKADLPEAEIEKIKKETALKERLAQNQLQAEKLTGKTLNSIRALVEVLGEGVSEKEKEALLEKFGVEKIPLGRGAFYDAHEIKGTDTVLKELKLNYLFGKEDAVRMLARHEVEAERIRDFFGKEFVPEFCFVYPEESKEIFEKEKEKMGQKGAVLYDLPTFIRIQADRRLQEGFKRRDVEEGKGVVAKAFQQVGALLKESSFFRKETAGVMVEEKVVGITFADCMQRFNEKNCPNWQKLKGNVELFLNKLGKFNEEYSMLWHRLDSDNVVVETDEQGNPTGRIRILDLNFTERSTESIRKATVKKTEKAICAPLREAFDIKE